MPTPSPVRFAFDPLCPWCYQTSRWIRRLAELGEITLDWALFSLEIANDGIEAARSGRAARALRTAVAVRDADGADALGAFYRALGARVHERGEDVADPAVVAGALRDAGLDPARQDQALADDTTWDAVVAEHTALVERSGAFGVPTIVLDGGRGPALFGPVISEPPASDADAVELWRHVSWLARYEDFAELKRDRAVSPELESVRRHARERAAAG